METVYVYQHDKFGNNGDFACTFPEFVKMVQECFPEFQGKLEAFGGNITDQDNEIICREVTSELIADYYDGDISDVIDPDNLINKYLELSQ